jgi:hypothetical protein
VRRYIDEELELGKVRAVCWVTKYPNLLGRAVQVDPRLNPG